MNNNYNLQLNNLLVYFYGSETLYMAKLWRKTVKKCQLFVTYKINSNCGDIALCECVILSHSIIYCISTLRNREYEKIIHEPMKMMQKIKTYSKSKQNARFSNATVTNKH